MAKWWIDRISMWPNWHPRCSNWSLKTRAWAQMSITSLPQCTRNRLRIIYRVSMRPIMTLMIPEWTTMFKMIARIQEITTIHSSNPKIWKKCKRQIRCKRCRTGCSSRFKTRLTRSRELSTSIRTLTVSLTRVSKDMMCSTLIEASTGVAQPPWAASSPARASKIVRQVSWR